MSVLSRDALQDSPLADLHEIASALGIDGFRRLRKDDLVDAILARQGGSDDESGDQSGDDAPARPPRARRSRTRKPAVKSAPEAEAEAPVGGDEEDAAPARPRTRRRRSGAAGEAPGTQPRRTRPRGRRPRRR